MPGPSWKLPALLFQDRPRLQILSCKMSGDRRTNDTGCAFLQTFKRCPDYALRDFAAGTRRDQGDTVAPSSSSRPAPQPASGDNSPSMSAIVPGTKLPSSFPSGSQETLLPRAGLDQPASGSLLDPWALFGREESGITPFPNPRVGSGPAMSNSASTRAPDSHAPTVKAINAGKTACGYISRT